LITANFGETIASTGTDVKNQAADRIFALHTIRIW
jgi:hypothetical protein